MIPESTLTLRKVLPNASVPELKTFKFIKMHHLGVFGESSPFIYFDDFVSKSLVEEAQKEIHKQDELLKQNSKLLAVNGIVPKEINGGIKSIDSLLMNYEKYLRQDRLQDFSRLKYLSEVKEFINFENGQAKYWDRFVHLRQYSTFNNKSADSDWLPFAEHLPAIQKLVNSLPFESIGYAVLFYSNPSAPVYIHRDVYPKDHNSTFISIDMNLKPRDFFIFNPVTQEKLYKSRSHYSFMFNECDLHGSDLDSEQHITLRIQGKFSASLRETLKIGQQKVFSWENQRSRDLLLKEHEIFEETDI